MTRYCLLRPFYLEQNPVAVCALCLLDSNEAASVTFVGTDQHCCLTPVFCQVDNNEEISVTLVRPDQYCCLTPVLCLANVCKAPIG